MPLAPHIDISKIKTVISPLAGLCSGDIESIVNYKTVLLPAKLVFWGCSVAVSSRTV